MSFSCNPILSTHQPLDCRELSDALDEAQNPAQHLVHGLTEKMASLHLAFEREHQPLLPDEAHRIAHTWIEQKKSILPNCTDLEKKNLQDLFRNFFHLLVTAQDTTRWMSGFLDLFDFTFDEKKALAYELLSHSPETLVQNIVHFHFPDKEQSDLAREVLTRQLFSAVPIESFQIEDDDLKTELALEEVKHPFYSKDFLTNLPKYHLHAPHNKLKIAKKVLELAPNAFIACWKLFGIEAEADRFELLKEASCRLSGSRLFFDTLIKSVSEAHVQEILVHMSERVLSPMLFSYWGSAHFERQKTRELLRELITKNPSLLFEHMNYLPLDIFEKDDLAVQVEIKRESPLCRVTDAIEDLYTEILEDFRFGHPKPYRAIRNRLVPIFQELHRLSQRMPLPPRFLNEGFKTLSNLVAKLVHSCYSPKQIDDLLSIISQNFCPATLLLLTAIRTEMEKKLPKLNVLFEKRVPTDDPLRISVATAGITLLSLTKICRSYKPGSPINIMAIEIKDLAFCLGSFSKVDQRGIIILRFPRNDNFHFSPLFVEQQNNTLHIVSTDSVGGSNQEFVKEIKDELQKCKGKVELYHIAQSRQNDGFSCAIFSLMDLSSVIKIWNQNEGEESLIRVLKEQPEEKLQETDYTYPIHTLRRFPTHMLRMSQYMDSLQDRVQETFTKKSGDVTTLGKYFQDHTFYYSRNGRIHRGNLTSSEKLCTYTRKLLQMFLI